MSIEIYTDLGQKINYKSFIFSGGEVSVKLEQEFLNSKGFIITAFLKSSDDIMLLLNLTDAIKHQYGFNAIIHLVLNYCPYARQDRVCDKGESFGLKVFANIINAINFASVGIVDPHSDVAPALFTNGYSIDLAESFDKKYIENIDYLVSPDAGSNKKVFKLSQKYNIPMVRADKLRDLTNGQILETIVYTDDLTGKRVLIVDDICDGGRTFTELAKQLINKGATVDLYITYGIFSKGKEVLKMAGIDNIYCPYEF